MSETSTLLDRIVFYPVLCEGWKVYMEGAAYQLANFFLLLGFMGGSGFIGSIYIFGFFTVGFLCLALWGWLDACGLDIFTWNILLVLISFLQLAHLFYQLHKHKFSEEFDQLYKQVCQPLHVPSQVYKDIVKCCEEQVLHLAKDQTYAVEGKTSIDRLYHKMPTVSNTKPVEKQYYLWILLLVEGMSFSLISDTAARQAAAQESQDMEELSRGKSGQPPGTGIHFTSSVFQNVSELETECSFITWQRKKLYLLLSKERYIARLFSVLLGYDISEKVYALNEKLFAKFGLRFDIRLPSLYHVLGPASSDTEVEKEAEECEEPPVPLSRPPTFVQTAPVAPHPGFLPAHPRKPRPDSDLSGEDSTSLVLEDFAELTGSFMDYVSEGEYMK
ncbi:hypothetical protein JD844_010099 [Phrynosoma platyrhinos]|uniref:POPDC1-3 domain-containing protein n=1 Tax=Phrynosoma platyrhinos TaxID=52577 RepID=A0ABQ7TG11_PHRPL|nr:hypothetical protein JD844_010099 [Phrynosoma platyrhinos]